ncbi:MAG TPA: ASCH domain-containing protein, partial [Vicinamibacterales bacterium]|nr:ASCH domain-containing protein [Vicinamibacterales bacterium]
MMFAKQLRERIRRGRIRCTVRVWTGPRVKVGGRYRMDEGRVVVDSIEPIRMRDITYALARESGFDTVEDLLRIAKHGRG